MNKQGETIKFLSLSFDALHCVKVRNLKTFLASLTDILHRTPQQQLTVVYLSMYPVSLKLLI